MNCENCKERPASVLITHSYMGESIERQLCDKCAFQSQTFHFDMGDEPLSIQQFLSHWLSGMDSLQQKQARGNEVMRMTCPSCNLTFEKFLDIGKFGCATCYETFRERLPHVFGKLHNGHTTHAGKTPASFNELFAVKRKIEEIRDKMQRAVYEERFEEAAKLRDEASALQHHLSHGGELSDE